jgi:periplasmic copper chaperone A
MNRRLLLQLAAALSLTFASILAIAVAGRADAGGIEVREAFARASIGQATAGAVYLRIVNHASSPDRLMAASTPVAARTDLHMTVRDGDVVPGCGGWRRWKFRRAKRWRSSPAGRT